MDSSSTSSASYKGPVNEVSIDFSDDVKAKLEGIDSFDMVKFCETVINNIDSNNLFSASSDKSLKILIKRVEIKSTPSTIQSDILSDSEQIAGEITIKNKSQQIVGQHVIVAKRTGDQDNVGTEWLYKQFASLTSKSMNGELDKSSMIANKTTNPKNSIAEGTKSNSENGFMQVLGVIVALAAFAAGLSAGF